MRLLGRKLWGHWQNLSTERDDGSYGKGFPWQGRAWLYLQPDDREEQAQKRAIQQGLQSTTIVSTKRNQRSLNLSTEWYIRRRLNFDLSLAVGDGMSDSDLLFHMAVPFLSLWFGIEGLFQGEKGLLRYRGYKEGRELGWSIHDGAIWFRLWSEPHEWQSRAPFSNPSSSKRQPVLHLDNLLLGKVTYSKRDIDTMRVSVLLPEGTYPATVKLFESAWSRPRWRTRTIRRAEITPDVPIPIPGKGENGWDCDDDATHSLTTPASTPQEAVNTLVADILETREKRAGLDWVPAAGWPIAS